MRKGEIARIMRKPGLYRLLSSPGKTDKYVMVKQICSKHMQPFATEVRNLQLCQHANVCISKEKLLRLESGREEIVTYTANQRWVELLQKYNKHPQNFAVRFYCVPEMIEFAAIARFVASYKNDTQIIVRI